MSTLVHRNEPTELAERNTTFRERCGPLLSLAKQKGKGRRKKNRRPATSTTLGARRIEMSLRVLELEQELNRLRDEIDHLLQFVDEDEIRAKGRLEKSTPTNTALLKLVAERPAPPQRYSDFEEEKPW